MRTYRAKSSVFARLPDVATSCLEAPLLGADVWISHQPSSPRRRPSKDAGAAEVLIHSAQCVIPAQAGIQGAQTVTRRTCWVPACAGMTHAVLWRGLPTAALPGGASVPASRKQAPRSASAPTSHWERRHPCRLFKQTPARPLARSPIPLVPTPQPQCTPGGTPCQT